MVRDGDTGALSPGPAGEPIREQETAEEGAGGKAPAQKPLRSRQMTFAIPILRKSTQPARINFPADYLRCPAKDPAPR